MELQNVLEIIPVNNITNFWINNYVAIPAFLLTITFGLLVIFKAPKGIGSLILKTLVTITMLATIPLTLDQIGIDIYLKDYSLVTYLSMLGTIVTLTTGIPFLFTKNKDISTQNTQSKTITNTLDTSINTNTLNTNMKTKYSGNEDSMYTINMTTGNGPSKTLKLPGIGHIMTIGRAEDNNIVITDPKVSRYHAKFFILPNKYRIEDIGSTNGTYVNGQKISNTLLKTNDMVKVGETKIDLGLDRNQAFVRGAYPSFDHIAPKRPPNIPENISENISGNISGNISEDTGEKTFVKNKIIADDVAWVTVNSGKDIGGNFKIEKKINTIGRSSNNEISISDSYVSQNHSTIKKNNNKFEIFDNASTTGTSVNNEQITGVKLPINATIQFGDTEAILLSVSPQSNKTNLGTRDGTLEFEKNSEGFMLCITKGIDSGKSIQLKDGKNHVGRDKNNNILINDSAVSRNHCIILKKNNTCTVYELGSESGTYVNKEPVKGKLLQSGDSITIGKTQLVFTSVKLNT